MWHYLFFIVYLKDKNPVEYTGIESYVSEKLKNNDIYWFPIQKSFLHFFFFLKASVLAIIIITTHKYIHTCSS